jgi:hypothetical protein
LTLRPQIIYELYHNGEEKSYRFKTNIPVFSNTTGSTRNIGEKILFLSREIPSVSDNQAESLILSGNDLLQSSCDQQPISDMPKLSAQASQFPVYVHQGDVPDIVPPAGLSGSPSKGILLSNDIPDNVFAIIRLTADRNLSDFGFVDNSGFPEENPPVFQVRFKNRSTIWSYRNRTTGVINSSESKPLPLTYFGNAGSKQKPSTGMVKPVREDGKISRLESEIYV